MNCTSCGTTFDPAARADEIEALLDGGANPGSLLAALELALTALRGYCATCSILKNLNYAKDDRP